MIGGGERYVYNLARALNAVIKEQDLNISQSIVSIGNQEEITQYKDIEVKTLRNISPFSGSMDSIPDLLWSELEGFDLVHIHQSLTTFGAYAISIARSKNIPIVSTDLGGGDSALMLYGKGLELSNSVLSISNYAKSLISTNFSAMHEVIIGPVDTSFFTPDKTVNRKKNQAICVSRILPHKGIDRIIAALPNTMRLLVVGQVYDNNYFGLLQELSRTKDVEFIHNADDEDLLHLYRTSSIFIQASTHKDYYGNVILKPELMGLTTLEAMSCGLPVVVSDAGSLPELVTNQKYGRVFSSHEELQEILNEHANSKSSLFDTEESVRKHVVNSYSFSSVGDSLLTLYKKTLASSKDSSVKVQH